MIDVCYRCSPIDLEWVDVTGNGKPDRRDPHWAWLPRARVEDDRSTAT